MNAIEKHLFIHNFFVTFFGEKKVRGEIHVRNHLLNTYCEDTR